MMMSTPRSEQGQIVVRSYGWCDGQYYCRTFDRSDRSESWERACDPDEIPDHYDAGGEDYPPPVTEWVPCDEPSEGD